jgi:hypothetical protein
MGLEYVCQNKGHFFRINTDVPHDDSVCGTCGGVLEKIEYGFTEPESPKQVAIVKSKRSHPVTRPASTMTVLPRPVAKKVIDMSEVEKLEIVRNGGDI